MHEFPAKPKNGTVFEVRNGLYYVYEAATRSWVRVAGGGQLFPLATPVQSGLMAAADLKKINRVLVPMPSSTIKGENCEGRFVSGHISMYSADDYLRITGEPLIRNTGVAANLPFRISQNTAGFDFSIDKVKLIQELISRGQINLTGPRGRQGIQGPTGNPGGSLPTGPKGPKGPKGTSPPCTITILPDPAPFEIKDGTNRAVVGITTQQISDNEFVIIAQRGIVGNPNTSPYSVNVNCGNQSTWVVAVANTDGNAQAVYYIDLSAIIQAIQDKFESELLRLKQGHEEVVGFWLQKMSQLFNAQKAVLCCAVTKCVSFNAQQAQKMSIEGVVNIAGSVTTTSADEEEGGEEAPALLGRIGKISLPHEPGDVAGEEVEIAGAIEGDPFADVSQPAEEEYFHLDVDGLLNSGSPKQASAMDLPPGMYVVEVVGCCIKTGGEYVGDVRLIYNNAGAQQHVQFVRPGTFDKMAAAVRAYDGLTMEINHSGGSVQSYMPSSLSQEMSGLVRLKFTRKSVIPQQVSLSTPHILACSMTRQKLDEYEEAWRTGKCCGMVMRIAGQDYIIIKRSVPVEAGGDALCGGEEDPAFECFQKFSTFSGTPAFAWPTFDGKTFMKLDRPAFLFKVDQDLENLVAHNLRENLFASSRMAADAAGPEDAPLPLAPEVWVSRAQPVVARQISRVLFPIL